MTTKHQPATPLPWHLGVRQAQQIVYDEKGWAVANATVYHGHADRDEASANAAYIAHTANNYEKLVEEIDYLIDILANVQEPERRAAAARRARHLLRDLGEAP